MIRAVVLLLAAGAALAADLDLQGLLDRAVAEGAATVTVPPGTHRRDAPLRLRGARRLAVEAEGAVLVLTSPTATALEITGADQVAVRGLTIDYDPLPFTQGRVTALNEERTVAAFAIDDGYPRLTAPYAVERLHLFTADGSAWKPGAPDLYAEETRILAPDRGEARFRAPQPWLAVGDRVALNRRADPGIRVQDCPGEVALERVRIHAAPGLAVMQRFCLGRLRLQEVVVGRGPLPAGAEAGRLLSSCADGVNVAYVRQGPLLDRCDLAWMGDDGLNIHGVALPVVRVEAPDQVVVARPFAGERWDRVVRPGDPVRRLAPDTFAPTGTAILAGIDPLPGLQGLDPAALRPLHYHQGGPHLWRVRFQGDAGLRTGDWIDLPAISGQDWSVTGCAIHDHRARGLRVMAARGLVEGNRFARSKQAAISVGAEYGHWREAGWVEDVTVRGNRIEDAWTGPVPPERDVAPAAIAVFVHLDRDDTPAPPAHCRIRITGNTIAGSGSGGILVHAARDCTVEGNDITGAAGVPPAAAAIHHLPGGVLAVDPAALAR